MLLEKNRTVNWLKRSQAFVELVTKGGSIHEKRPAAMTLLAQSIGAGQAIWVEFHPSQTECDKTNLQQIFSLSITGQVQEVQLPNSLGRVNFPVLELKRWLDGFELVDGGIVHSENNHKHLAEDRLSRILFQYIVVTYKSFAIFPLLYEEEISGVLFLFSAQEKEWPSEGLLLCEMNSKLFANLLFKKLRSNHEAYSTTFLKEEDSNINLADKSQDTEPQLLSAIASTIPDAIFLIDLATSKAVFTNIDDFLGYDISKYDNPTDAFFDVIHPDDREIAIFDFIGKLSQAKNNEVIEAEYRMRHRDGHIIWVRERAKVFRRFDDGIVQQYLTTIQAITKEKTAILKMQESGERYRNFLDYSTEGIYYINCGEPIPRALPVQQQMDLYFENAFLQECNAVVAQWTGFSNESELIGKRIADLPSTSLFATNEASFSELLQRNYRVVEADTSYEMKGGEQRYFITRGIGIFKEDQLIGIWCVQRDVTAKRLAEKALQKSELMLSAVVHDAQMGIWEWYFNQDVIKVNKELLGILGLPQDYKSLPRKIFEGLIGDEGFRRLNHSMTHHVSQQTDNFQEDVLIDIPNGDQRWIQIHGRLVERDTDGKPFRLSGTLFNIHDLKEAELQLAEGEALLKAVLNAMPDVKLRMDSKGVVKAVYASTLDNHELVADAGNLVGKNLTQVLPVFVARGIIFNAKSILEGKHREPFEFINQGKTGVNYFETRIRPINGEEVIMIIRDITPLKEAEHQVGEQMRMYENKTRQLEKYIESNLQLENFAYIASHDLREPLRTIRQFSQVLKRKVKDKLDGETMTYFNYIIDGAKRMNQLIEDLLEFSRVQSDNYDKEAINLGQLLEEIVNGLHQALQESGGSVQFPNLPKQIYGNKIRVQQLFQNLIANGIKFRKSDEAPVVVVSYDETSTHWEFSVSDNGIGIDEEFFDQIFVIFKKLHTRDSYEGTGIGLALVQRIVEKHGGEIYVKSQAGKGTTFVFSIQKGGE